MIQLLESTHAKISVLQYASDTVHKRALSSIIGNHTRIPEIIKNLHNQMEHTFERSVLAMQDNLTLLRLQTDKFQRSNILNSSLTHDKRPND